MAIFPLAPDQTIAQMWSKGVQGGVLLGVEIFTSKFANTIQDDRN